MEVFFGLILLACLYLFFGAIVGMIVQELCRKVRDLSEVKHEVALLSALLWPLVIVGSPVIIAYVSYLLIRSIRAKLK